MLPFGETRWVCRRDRQTDGRQTVALRFPQDANSVITAGFMTLCMDTGDLGIHGRPYAGMIAFTARPISNAYIARYICYMAACVCLLQVGVLSKRLNRPSWFSAWRLGTAYPALYYKEILLSLTTRLLFPDSEVCWFFSAFTPQHVGRLTCDVNLVGPSHVYHSQRSSLFTTR